MRRLFLVPALGVVGLALAAPASAQLTGRPDLNRPSYADEARQPYNESRRVAYDNGYREGIKEGERDARRRDVFNYQDERTWQRADKGYHRSYGDSQRYQQIVPNRIRGRLLRLLPALCSRLRLPGQRRDLPEYRRRLRLSEPGRLRLPQGRVVTAIPDRAATAIPGAGRLRLQPGVRQWHERRLREGPRRRTRPRRIRPAAAQVVSGGRPRLQELVWSKATVRERLPAGLQGRLRARLSRVELQAVASASATSCQYSLRSRGAKLWLEAGS